MNGLHRPTRLTQAQICLLNDLGHGAVARNVGHQVETFMLRPGDRRAKHTGNDLSHQDFAQLCRAVPEIEALWPVNQPNPDRSTWRVASANRGHCLDLVQELMELPRGYAALPTHVTAQEASADEHDEAPRSREMCHVG